MAGGRVNGAENPDARVEGDDFPIIGSTVTTDGDSDESIPVIDPTRLKADPGDGAPRRGRPKRGNSTSSSTKQQSAKETQADLTSILVSVHFMLAMLTKQKALEMDDDEAKKLAEALARVQREFGVTVMSPKVAALVNLGMVGLGVYGPRVVTMANEAAKKKKGKQGVTIDAEPIGVTM